jgi:hypothetical protein
MRYFLYCIGQKCPGQCEDKFLYELKDVTSLAQAKAVADLLFLEEPAIRSVYVYTAGKRATMAVVRVWRTLDHLGRLIPWEKYPYGILSYPLDRL